MPLSALLRQPTILALLVANFVPLVGVLLLGRDVGGLVLLYCLEALLMQVFFAARIVTNTEGSLAEKVAFLPFFTAGYLVVLGGETLFALVTFYTRSHDGPTFMSMSPQELWAVFETAVHTEGTAYLAVCLAFYAGSHGWSFVRNYYRTSARDQDLEWLVFKPFGRVAAVALVVIPGGMLLYFHGSTWYFALALAAFKSGADLLSHWGEHRTAYRESSEGRG
jgi:hypothetical protein